MARHHTCDKTGSRLIEPELTTLAVRGPLASIVNRRELHLGKEAAYDLAEWLGFVVARPEGLEADLAARRSAIERGSLAGSTPPAPRSRSKGKRA